ncbi:hypothetical protein [Selenomonas sp. AE3005]|uniref:hypothetical protein n=1 Tax=Selenomonas sp. AE3005 TaxID=1485543 RepID=UPI0025D6F3D7|nr:hypothetical protein [Selenomonas sp. AE3005]
MKKAVLVSCFDWYEKRLKPIRDLLIEKGYDVKILLSDFDHTNKQKCNKLYDSCTYLHVPIYKKNISLQRIMSHISFARQCKKYIEKYKPDIIYCLVPPNKVVDYCANYKKRNPTVKLIVDIIDMWPESMPLKKVRKLPLTKRWMNWRDDAIKIADYVFTECNLYQDKLAYVLNPAKTSTLYLYKEQSVEERQLILDILNKNKKDDIIRFAYLGSMNYIIDISSICKVIKAMINQGKSCELHAIGDGESRERFAEEVKATGCKTYFYGLIFDEFEKIRIIAPCDYGFNMMKNDVSVGLTIKSIDYLSYGLPLINNIKGDTWRLIEDQNIGINIKNDYVMKKFNHQEIFQFFERKFTKKSFTDTINQAFSFYV